MMDPVTRLVDLLRPKALLWKHMRGRGDWAWRFPADAGVVFGLVVEGNCRFEHPSLGAQAMGPGDSLLMAAPPSWAMRGGDPTRLVDFGPAAVEEPETESSCDAKPVTKIVGGHFEFCATNADLLVKFLTPGVHLVRACDRGSNRLGKVLSMIDEEVSSYQPGRDAMLNRLLEIVLIELLRAPPEKGGELRSGMLAGLADSRIALAMKNFHAAIDRDWTVDVLARCAGMSRSNFYRRFNQLVGEPPMTYVLNWRMAFAKDALRHSGRSLEQIALDTGYGSASAFSTAFARTVGRSPAKFAKDAKADV